MIFNEVNKQHKSYTLLSSSRPQYSPSKLRPVRSVRPQSVNYSCRYDESSRKSYRKSLMPDQLARISQLPLDLSSLDRTNLTYRVKNHVTRQHKFALDHLKHLKTLKPALENLYHSLLKTRDLPYMIQVVEFLSNRLDENDKNRMIKKGCPLCSCTCKDLEGQENIKGRRSESPTVKKVPYSGIGNSVSTLDLAKLREMKVCSSCDCVFLTDSLSLVTECLLCLNQCYPETHGDSVQLQMSVTCSQERIAQPSETRLCSRPVSQQRSSNRSASRCQQAFQSCYTREVQTDPILTHIILNSGSQKMHIETNSTQVCRFLLPTNQKNNSESISILNKTDSRPYLYTYEDIQKDTQQIDQTGTVTSFDYLKNLEGPNSQSSDEKDSKCLSPEIVSINSSPAKRHHTVHSMIDRTEIQNINKDSPFLPAGEAEELFTYYKDLKQCLVKSENELSAVEIDQQEILTDENHEYDIQDNLEETLSKYLHIIDSLLCSVHKLEPRLAVSIWRCYLGTVLQCEYSLKQNAKTSKINHLENEEIKKRDGLIQSLRNKITYLQGKIKKTEDLCNKKIEDIQELNLRYQTAINIMKNKVSLVNKTANTTRSSR